MNIVKRGFARLKQLFCLLVFLVWLFFYCLWYWVRGKKPPKFSG